MPLVTLGVLPLGCAERRKTVGEMRIINSDGNAAYGNYSIELKENRAKSGRTFSVIAYPRHAGSTWDLVARAKTTRGGIAKTGDDTGLPLPGCNNIGKPDARESAKLRP